MNDDTVPTDDGDVDVPAGGGFYADGGLDAAVDRNDFTPEQAVRVFEEARKAIENTTGDTLKSIMDKAFDLLPIIIGIL